MSEYLKVKDHPDLYKDSRSDHIVNTNVTEYEQYMARRAARKIEKQKAQHNEQDLISMKSDLDNLKGEIGEIKSLLKELVSNVN